MLAGNFFGCWVNIGSGDLNSDGYTDLYGTDGSTRLGVFYGAGSRTFSSYFSTLPPGYITAPADGFQYNPQLAMADFNGDGRMDLVAFNYVPVQGGSNEYLAFFLAGANPGAFTIQTPSISSYIYDTAPVTGASLEYEEGKAFNPIVPAAVVKELDDMAAQFKSGALKIAPTEQDARSGG